MESAHRNKSVRRSRALATLPGIRRRPNLATRPQLDGLAPAIPRERSELADARRVFAAATNDATPIGLEQLQRVLAQTSHTDAVITLRKIEELQSAVSVLGMLRIPISRLRLEIRSLPRSADDPKEWIQRLSNESGLPSDQIRLAADNVPVTTSARTHPAGMLALRIESDHRVVRSTPKDGPDDLNSLSVGRLSYGWRVGLYYAVCVRLASIPGD